jgi:putrescine transport system substrate-binding protein
MSPKIVSLVSALVLAGSAGFASAQERVVNVYNWSDYIDASILEDFTKETGIKVVYDVFDSNEIVETKLLAGGTGYDVVVPTADFLQRQIKAGVFQKLDKSKLPNITNMWDMVLERTAKYDPGNEYAMDYMWGTNGIGYNVAKAKEILGPGVRPGLEAIFDPAVAAKFKDCGIYVLDAPKDVLPAALTYLGLNPDTRDPAELEKAGELMLKARPFIRKFHSSEYINALANGDICLAFGYSAAGAVACRRSQGRRRGELLDPIAGCTDVVRHDGDPRRRTACRGSPRLHQLHDEARSNRQGIRLRVLRQRQQGLPAVRLQGRAW